MPQREEALIGLFRAVSKAELDDIAIFGGFRQKPGGLSYEGKLFAASAKDAANFGRMNYRLDTSLGLDNPFHIIEVSVPSSLVAQFTSQTLDGMPTVYVSGNLLPLLNRYVTMREISVMPCRSA